MRAFVVPTVFAAIDKFTAPIRKMGESIKRFANKSVEDFARMERNWRKLGDSAMRFGRQSLLAAGLLIAPLVLFSKAAMDFEDKMADVGKTTGMQGAELEMFGDKLLEMSTKTRTSIDELLKIGEIGGQLGVAKNELLAFTDSANKFNVALGSDFSGGVEEAISSVGNIKALFAQTRDLDISDVIRRTGSAINELGAVGSGTSANITDFTLRLGALPDALKPSVQNTMALATALEEMGINSEIGARGIGDVITTAGANLPAFAKQMQMSADAARELLSTDSTEFLKRFAQSFEGMDTVALSEKLKELKIGDTGTIKVIGALASGTERLTYLQGIANDSFEKGTSLQAEYDKKNSTAAAKWEILKNNIKAASITLGQALLPVILDLMQTVTPMIQKFGKWAKENKAFLGTVLKIVGTLGAFSGVISVLSFSFGGVAKTISFAAKAMGIYKTAVTAGATWTKIFSASLMGIPIFWIIAGIAALSYGIYKLVQSFKSLSAEQRVNSEVNQRVLENTADQRAEVQLYITTLKYATQGSAAYNDALEKLEEIQPGVVEKFNLQEKSLRNIIAAEKELISTILERAKTQAQTELLTEKFKKLSELESSGEQGPGFWDFAAPVLTMGVYGSGFSGNNFEEQSRLDEMSLLREDIDVLSRQMVGDQLQAVNPSGERQKSMAKGISNTLKELVTVDFKNVPLGTEISRQNMGKSGAKLAMPGLSSTR